jgi:hypothetical protein
MTARAGTARRGFERDNSRKPLFSNDSPHPIQRTIKLAPRAVSLWNIAGGYFGEGVVYPNVHFFHRQAAREKLAAKRALTEAARERHLALAADYEKRAETLRPAASA